MVLRLVAAYRDALDDALLGAVVGDALVGERAVVPHRHLGRRGERQDPVEVERAAAGRRDARLERELEKAAVCAAVAAEDGATPSSPHSCARACESPVLT